MDLSSVSVLAELERAGLGYEYASQDEVRMLCPFHEHKGQHTPSCMVNVQKRIFACKAAQCMEGGDFVKLMARALRTTRDTVIADLTTRYGLSGDRTVDPDYVERCHQAIWQAGPLLQALYDRGVTDHMIRHYRFGVDDGRITIPVKNENGYVVNLRKYLPGAPGPQKMKNLPGRGKVRIWPEEQMRYEELMLCGGEMKAAVAAEQLNKHNIGAITLTGGEGNWAPEYNHRFIGKKVIVCLDTDEGGVVGTQTYCSGLYGAAEWIGAASLASRLDSDRYPKGDINDFVGREHGDVIDVWKEAVEWTPAVAAQHEEEEPLVCNIRQAMGAEHVGRKVSVQAVVAAAAQSPFLVPKNVRVECTKNQPECRVCAAFRSQAKSPEFTVPADSSALLEMVSAGRDALRIASMRAIDVPVSCKVAHLHTLDHYQVNDIRISPKLEIESRELERTMQPAICIGDDIELNEPYELTGRCFPHPRTQESTLVVNKYKHSQDALTSWKPDCLEDLKLFQPAEWSVEGIQQKLDALYSDLETNVTRIFQRRDIHLVADLAYHSALSFRFDKKPHERPDKGWVEVLIVGDTAQGKSEVTNGHDGHGGLMRHYGLGEMVEAKNATVAGLVGGLQQMGGTKWFVSWGIIPTHDRRLVIIEEVKGMSTEVISKTTGMRSSGEAQIPKIEKRKAHARTRLIWNSNPRGDLPMSSFNFGIEAIRELIGSPEDIRRFDMAMIAAAQDVDPLVINQLKQDRPIVEHLHTTDLCRKLVLWTWTRTTDEIVFEEESTRMILREATTLGMRYSDAIPLVDKGSMRLKLARLAVSLAGRTFSCSDDGKQVIVRPCHVQYIVNTLIRLYDHRSMGYADFTEAMALNTELLNPEDVRKALIDTPFVRDLCKQMLHTTSIALVDLQDWCGWQQQDAIGLLSFLVRKHALVRDKRAYRKTPPFIVMLKQMLTEKLPERPNYVKDAAKF